MLGENNELKPSGSDVGGLIADLLEGARRRNLSVNSLTAYERTWRGRRRQVWIPARFLFLLPRRRIDF